MDYLKSLIQGRLGRKNFFLASILQITLFLLSAVTAANLSLSDDILWQKIIAWLVLAILWYFGYSISLRRLYDMNANKTLSIVLAAILGFFPAGYGLLFIFLVFKKGTQGPNKYGEINTSKFVDAIFKLKRTSFGPLLKSTP